MSNHKYNNAYDQSAFDRLYGNSDDIITSRKEVSGNNMTPEEEADYLFANGFLDVRTVSRKAVIEKITSIHKKRDY